MVERKHAVKDKYRSCYQCRGHFGPDMLHGGLCPMCQAKKVVLNYGCYGDPVSHTMDYDRLDILVEAIRIIRESYTDPHDMYV